MLKEKIKTRPKRESTVLFFVTEEEKSEIVNAAIAHDMSISDYCRRTLLSTARMDMPAKN